MAKDRYDPNSQRVGSSADADNFIRPSNVRPGGSAMSTASRKQHSGSGRTAVARNHPQKLRG